MKSNKEIPTFKPVKDISQLTQLNGYQIANTIENIGNDGRKSTIIILKIELPKGGFKYRDLMLCSSENQFVSDEY
ncbi:hypothetical protein [Ruminiclostridium cellobioparum]|uniref:hypothetical protein n=1 Tax=Ruminiclostridium cellobioparum TaxID=29355 RepID=UPI0028B01650|nr:hypothetical protein [Ruminiclostridium cellobioparum]